MENIIHYLDLVAVAIAADIVPLIGENRILTYVGLQVINSNPRLGLHCLLQNNNKKEFNVGDLMFYVGPRINAAGRMDHASLSLELLLEKDLNKGEKLAFCLDTKKNSAGRLIDINTLTYVALHELALSLIHI